MPSLDDLRKHAKDWLKEVRRRNPGPVKRLRLAYPKAPADPVLRDVQHALAREHGFESWQALKVALQRQDLPVARTFADLLSIATHADRVAMFLQFACWSEVVRGRGDQVRLPSAAATLLRKHPEIAGDSLFTAVVCGNVVEVERLISEDPALVNVKGGPLNREPILYLCYGRLPLEAAHHKALAIARLLLDRGANPNAYFMAGHACFGTLVGVAGEGEQEATPHAGREALYQLLLEYGAEPYDIQVLYNTHFSGDVLWWLRITHEHAVRRGRAADWQNPAWPMLDMGGYGSGARFVLDTAIGTGRTDLAEWALAHGADPNAPPPHAPGLATTSLHERAIRENRPAIADLLGRFGARRTTRSLEGEQAFVVACLRLDRAMAEQLSRQHPEYVHSPAAMFAAAARDLPEALKLLVDLGTPIDVMDDERQRPLHIAVVHDARQAAAFLVARGADVHARETRWNASPFGYASYHGRTEMIDLLSTVSRDVHLLASHGKVERLRVVLAEEPTRAREASASGFAPLWWLPDDERAAAEVTKLLLAYGADPTEALGSRTRMTAAESARQRGLDEAADLIDAAAARRKEADPTPPPP